MAVDEQQDWVDRAMAQGAWEPPGGFASRVVAASIAVLPPQRIRTFSLQGLRATVTGFGDSMRARFEGSAWVARQYRDLLLHSQAPQAPQAPQVP
jgi:hypothetical protein